MKSSAKFAIGILIVAIAVGSGASVFLTNYNKNSNLAVQPTTSPQVSAPTQQPTAQATASPSVPTITISYNSLQTGCGHYMIEIFITNQGYPNFNTDPTKFFVLAGSQKYVYSAALTQQYGYWNTTNVSNQGEYDGTLIFNAPSTVTSASLGYVDASYNIVYKVR